MKYPYITIDQRKPVLIYKDRRGIYMVDKNDTLSDLDITYAKRQKNQTAKVLANTYGEVKSKAHAEFIVKLAENHGYSLTGAVNKSNARTFVIDGENKLLFFMRGSSSFNGSTVKQITIPLPPECEERKPKEVIANGKKHTLNSVTGFYDFSVIDLGYATASTLEKLKMADDYQVISFVDECNEGKEDEWPKVGSKALLNNDNDYELDYGETLIGKEVEVINLFTDGDLEMAVVKHDVANYCFRIEMLSKPKSKEEKDRDEIKEEIKEIFREAMKSPFWFIYDSDEQAANYLLERFDINKKPQ